MQHVKLTCFACLFLSLSLSLSALSALSALSSLPPSPPPRPSNSAAKRRKRRAPRAQRSAEEAEMKLQEGERLKDGDQEKSLDHSLECEL